MNNEAELLLTHIKPVHQMNL